MFPCQPVKWITNLVSKFLEVQRYVMKELTCLSGCCIIGSPPDSFFVDGPLDFHLEIIWPPPRPAESELLLVKGCLWRFASNSHLLHWINIWTCQQDDVNSLAMQSTFYCCQTMWKQNRRNPKMFCHLNRLWHHDLMEPHRLPRWRAAYRKHEIRNQSCRIGLIRLLTFFEFFNISFFLYPRVSELEV